MANDENFCIPGHTVQMYDRGGRRSIGPALDLSSVQWGRQRDAISEAKITITGDACSRQYDFLSSLRTHRHEMAVFRGSDRVWEGPVHRIGDYSSRFEVVAHDVLQYLDAQPLTQTWSNAYPNTSSVTARIGEIIRYEMTHGRTQKDVNNVTVNVPAWESANPPANVVPHLQIHHFANEAGTSAVTEPYEMSVFQHLASLARQSGIDFTAVGRAIHIWDVSRSLGRTSPMSDENFLENVILTEYGADHTQAAYVVSSDGAYGSAITAENLDYYGPWTKVFTTYNEEGTEAPTVVELNSQARRNLAGRTPVPIEVRIPDNSTILLTDAFTIHDLVPGVQVPLRAVLNARKMDQLQKIDSVTVIENENGETIKVTLTPATKPDDDVDAEEQE